jgi:NodT family efflux transporter outer membrane factor (OMF) lipoprotein
MTRPSLLRPVFVPLCLALLLAGCAIPSPNTQRSEFMEPPAMERTLGAAGARENAAWPSADWWRRFRSADLDHVMAKALADNQTLQKATDKLHETEAASKVEGSRLLPFLDADIGMRQSRIPNHGVVASYNSALAGQEKTMAFLNPLSLRYELDFWGKNRAALDAALGESAAQEAEYAQTRLLLTTGVARAWFRGAALSRQLALAQATTKLRHDVIRLAETRVRTGLEAADATPLAIAEAETATKREAGLRALLAYQEDMLARLMGEGPDAGRALFSSRGANLPASFALPKRLPVELLAHRPDLAAAMRRAEAAAERIHIAKAEFLPTIDLSAVAGLEASTQTTRNVDQLASLLFRGSAFNYVIAPGVHLPLFEGGRLRGKLEGRRAEYDEAVDSYNETLLQAAQQVADALATQLQARASLDAQARIVGAARAQLSLARTRWNTGLKDKREILGAAAIALDQQLLYEQLKADYMTATVDVLQALGGGYAEGPDVAVPQLAPEKDAITPIVETIQALGGG